MNDKTILLKSISWASYTEETAYEMLKSESFNVKVLPFEKKVAAFATALKFVRLFE